MAAIAVIGLLMAGSLRVAAHARYVSAVGRYRTLERYYDEGRATLRRCVEESHALMEARLALCITTAGQVDVIKGHLARSCSLIKQELNQEPSCHDQREIEASEAQEVLDVARSRLKRLAGSGETRAPE